MRMTGNPLLLLALPATLIAQSEISQPQPGGFPPQITHVVVIVQENRSPDNLFLPLTRRRATLTTKPTTSAAFSA